MNVKKKLNSNFVRWNKTAQLKSSSSSVQCAKKSTWRVAFLSLKPQLTQDLQYVISLLFHSLSVSNISKITAKFSGLSVCRSRQFHSVRSGIRRSILLNGIAPFVKKIAGWSVQELRTQAVGRGDKPSLDIIWLAANLRITTPLPYAMRRLAKLLRTNECKLP